MFIFRRSGFYCAGGVDWPRPGNGTESYLAAIGIPDNCTCCGGANIGIGGICPRGHYCRQGSDSPDPCPPGTYSDFQGAWECKVCEAGYYCPLRSTDFLDKPCPAGHYCPPGTNYSRQYPCPMGKYNPYPNKTSPDDCLSCPPGQYCDSDGLPGTSGNCSAGHYCILESTTAEPVDSFEGSNCPPGFYCPEGLWPGVMICVRFRSSLRDLLLRVLSIVNVRRT